MFYGRKNYNLQLKTCNIFLDFAQNKDYGHFLKHDPTDSGPLADKASILATEQWDHTVCDGCGLRLRLGNVISSYVTQDFRQLLTGVERYI